MCEYIQIAQWLHIISFVLPQEMGTWRPAGTFSTERLLYTVEGRPTFQHSFVFFIGNVFCISQHNKKVNVKQNNIHFSEQWDSIHISSCRTKARSNETEKCSFKAAVINTFILTNWNLITVWKGSTVMTNLQRIITFSSSQLYKAFQLLSFNFRHSTQLFSRRRKLWIPL